MGHVEVEQTFSCLEVRMFRFKMIPTLCLCRLFQTRQEMKEEIL